MRSEESNTKIENEECVLQLLMSGLRNVNRRGDFRDCNLIFLRLLR
jgi:hypothetical protein